MTDLTDLVRRLREHKDAPESPPTAGEFMQTVGAWIRRACELQAEAADVIERLSVKAEPWQPVPPKACIKPTAEAAGAFWKYWRENGETHKHGYYESTWGAINAALAHGYAHPAAPAPEPPLYTIGRGSDGRATVTTTPAPDLIALVNQQAEDEGLWFVAQTAPEAYLQAALRKLHAAIEGEQEE